MEEQLKTGKVYLICGKICCGKTYYSKNLAKQNNAIILSCDEVTYDLFSNNLGDKHDEMVSKIKKYLHKKAVEITSAGCDVILDWGFWTRQERKDVSTYYAENGIQYKWHYIDVADDIWEKNIQNRNQKVIQGESADYYLDEGLLDKMNSLFEMPDVPEIDVWHRVSIG